MKLDFKSDKLDTLVLDLGSVLWPIRDEQEWVDDFLAPVLGKDADWKVFHKLFIQLEIGRFTPELFYDAMKVVSKRSFREDDLAYALNARLLEMSHKTVDLLHRLSETYTLYLLSNTNAIHIEEVDWVLNRTFRANVFKEVFKECFYSHELRCHKPDKKIYQMVEQRMGHPEKASFVFFDDSQANVNSASDLGWNAVRVDNGLVEAAPGLGLI